MADVNVELRRQLAKLELAEWGSQLKEHPALPELLAINQQISDVMTELHLNERQTYPTVYDLVLADDFIRSP